MDGQANDQFCVICQTDIDRTQTDDNVFTECLHCFHKECWDNYTQHKRQQNSDVKCPVCQNVQSQHIIIDIQPIPVTASRIHHNRVHPYPNSEMGHNMTTNTEGTTRHYCGLTQRAIVQMSIACVVICIVVMATLIWQQQTKP